MRKESFLWASHNAADNEARPGEIHIFTVCIYYQRLFGIKAQILISELSNVMHYRERKAAERPSSQITSISAAFPQISGVKGASSL